MQRNFSLSCYLWKESLVVLSEAEDRFVECVSALRLSRHLVSARQDLQHEMAPTRTNYLEKMCRILKIVCVFFKHQEK